MQLKLCAYAVDNACVLMNALIATHHHAEAQKLPID